MRKPTKSSVWMVISQMVMCAVKKKKSRKEAEDLKNVRGEPLGSRGRVFQAERMTWMYWGREG